LAARIEATKRVMMLAETVELVLLVGMLIAHLA